MIRHSIPSADLRARIKALKPTWFDRAKAITDALPPEPRSSDFDGLWSEIKEIYMDLQFSKCAFCEKPLENRIEQDVEHFRPKSEVIPWTPPQDLIDEGIELKQPDDGSSELGYRFLAYHPFNYAASCKNCNSVFKKNFFPVGKTRKTGAQRPPSDASEEPFLIYPIGDSDDDPESLITYEGLSPMAAPPAGRGRLRALVTIAIFKLGDPVERKVFFQERARAIERLFLALEAVTANVDAESVARAQAAVNRCLSPASPYASCLRCFKRMYDSSRADAQAVYDTIADFLDSFSPG